MKRRITYEVLAAGQPRPYADSITRARVTFESQGIEGYKDPDAPFKPDPYFSDTHEDRVRAVLRHLPVGFVDAVPEGWWSTRLDYLRTVKTETGGTWEFQTTSPYTD